jgi:hypothetical protein
MIRIRSSLFVLIAAALLTTALGCSGKNGPSEVLAEGVFEKFLRVEVEPPEEPFFVSCRKRTDGTGVDLLIVSTRQQVKGVEIPFKLESERLLIDIEWSHFGDGKKAVWLYGIEKLGEWEVPAGDQ